MRADAVQRDEMGLSGQGPPAHLSRARFGLRPNRVAITRVRSTRTPGCVEQQHGVPIRSGDGTPRTRRSGRFDRAGYTPTPAFARSRVKRSTVLSLAAGSYRSDRA